MLRQRVAGMRAMGLPAHGGGEGAVGNKNCCGVRRGAEEKSQRCERKAVSRWCVEMGAQADQYFVIHGGCPAGRRQAPRGPNQS